MTKSPPTLTGQVMADFKKIPPEKRSQKIQRTIWGVAIAALGWVAKERWEGMPDTLAFATVAFGFVTASGEVLLTPWRLFVAMLGDLLRTIRGKSSEAE